jgi:hypothetical protein
MVSFLMPKQSDDHFSDEEIARRYQATLKSVLAMPPQPKPKKASETSPPKKRGRPAKKEPV